MTKHLRNLCTLLLLAVASMAWADEVTVTKTVNDLVTANEWQVSSGTDVNGMYKEFSLDENITVSTSGEDNCGSVWGTTTYDWRLYQNKSGNVTITAASGCTLKSVKFEFSNKNNGTLLNGNTAITTKNDVSVSGSSVTFTVGNSSSNTNGQIRITSFSVTYEKSGTPAVTVDAPTFSPAAGEVEAGTEVTLTQDDAAYIMYTTDGTDPTLTNGTKYVSPIEITEAVTIKAIAVDDEENVSAVATAAYTVKDDTPASQYETVTLPYEEGLVSSQGKFVIEDVSLGGLTAVWKTSSYGMTANGNKCTDDIESWFVSPLIDATEASSLSMTFEQNLRYFASTDVAKEQATLWVREGAEGTWNQLTIPEFENVNNNTFSSAGTIDLSAYAGKTIQLGFKYLATTTSPGRWELKNLKVQAGEVVVLKDPELSFEESTFTATIGDDNEFPVLNNPNGLTVSYRVANESYATIDATSGEITLVAPGQTTVYAEFAGNDEYKEGSASYLLVVKEKAIEGTDKYELVTDASTLADGDEIIIASVDNTGLTTSKAMASTQNNNNRASDDLTLNEDGTVTPSNTIATIVLEEKDEAWLFRTTNGNETTNNQNALGYLYAPGGGNYLRTASTLEKAGDKAKASVTIDEDGNAVVTFQLTETGNNADHPRNILKFNPGTNGGIYSCYADNSSVTGTVQIYRKVAEAETIEVSVGAAGAATFSSTKAIDFTDSEDIYAYVAKLEGTKVNLTKVNGVVPAETGVLLRSVSGEAVTAELPVVASAEAIADNAFVAVLEDIASLATETTEDGVTYVNYILNKVNGVLDFYKAAGKKVAAGKAYLRVDKETASKGLTIGYEDDATGIKAIDNSQLTNDKVYNLAGQRVAKAQKGVYIVNGKKVVVR